MVQKIVTKFAPQMIIEMMLLNIDWIVKHLENIIRAEAKKQNDSAFILGDSTARNVDTFKSRDLINHICIVKKHDFTFPKMFCIKDFIKSKLRKKDPRHTILHVGTDKLGSASERN